jgi:hypothetical protein
MSDLDDAKKQACLGGRDTATIKRYPRQCHFELSMSTVCFLSKPCRVLLLLDAPWLVYTFNSILRKFRALGFVARMTASFTAPALEIAMTPHLTKVIYTGLLLVATVLGATSVSVRDSTPYLNQRECAKQCIWHVGATDDLIVALGCSSPWVNECYCRADLAPSGSSFLTRCVSSRCSEEKTGVDVGMAVSVWNGYCSDAGMPISVAAALTTASHPTSTDPTSRPTSSSTELLSISTTAVIWMTTVSGQIRE